jgi:acylphosphatase
MVRTRVVVTGLVQGVFYRDTCRREARRLGVAGWVANRDDGAVEAVFEGPEDAVADLLAWASRGPAQARVDDVRTEQETPRGEDGFRVV